MRSAFFSLLLALLTSTISLAQTGSNSSCATAIPLTVSPTNIQDALIPADGRHFDNAVPDPVTVCSGSLARTTAWFSFTATATKHWIRTDGGGTDDAIIEVFSGSCGALTSMNCFPANSATPALTGLSIGTTYYLRVLMGSLSYCQNNSQSCMVWIAVVSAATNDDCSGAIELPVTSGALTVHPGTEISTLGATQSQAVCGGDPGASDDDVWYRFTATSNAHFFPTEQLVTSGSVPLLEWFSGSCGSLTSIACDVDHHLSLSPGTEYHIRAYSTSVDPALTVRELAGLYAPAPNDECSGAVPIDVAEEGEVPQWVSVSTIASTSSVVPCDTRDSDVWLRFTAPGTSVVVVGDDDQFAAVYGGSCGSLTCVSADNMNPDALFTGLTAGDTYYLKTGNAIYSRDNIRIAVFTPAVNTTCETAIDVDVQAGNVEFTEGHTFNAAQQAWYSFTATATSLFCEAYATSSPGQVNVEAFSGACGGLTSIATGFGRMLMSGLVIGQQYHVRLSPLSRLAFRMAVSVPVENDECAGAIQLSYGDLSAFEASPLSMTTYASDGTGGCEPLRDVWYRFTAAHSSACFVAASRDQPSADATVELFSGPCGSLTSLGCTTGDWAIKAPFTGLTAGTEYHVRLSGTISWHYAAMLFDKPVNDEITGALQAPSGSSFARSIEEHVDFAATQSYAPHCNSWVPDDDTWFHFDATATSQTVTALQQNTHFSETPLLNGLWIEVYDTLSTDDAVLDANEISCGFSPRNLTGLIVGNDYWYRVYTGGYGAADLCAFNTSVSIADNDEANGAMPLSYGTDYTATFNTTGATQSLPDADCQVDDRADDDIWFSFTATEAPARLVVGYHTEDLTIELFSGTPENLTSLACDGNILELPALTAGQTYYARIYSWPNGVPVSGRIGLFTTPSLTANSCVDEACLGPVLLPNPSIEQGAYCLAQTSEVGAIAGYGTQLAPGWPRMQYGSSDGISSCADHDRFVENPSLGLASYTHRTLSRSGKGMGGIWLKFVGPFNYTEYLQAPLSQPLTPGEPYLISIHVTTDPEVLALSGVGAVLSEGPLPGAFNGPLEVTPDIISLEVIESSGWLNICGVVVPDRPMDHITIGAFQGQGQASYSGTYTQGAYYFIDDVVVAHIDDASCITGIGDVPPLDADANGSGDDLRVYPNPASERATIMLDANTAGQRGMIELFDATGKQVYGEQVSALHALQQLDLSSEWKEGLYLLMLRVEGQAPKSARIMLRR